MTENHDQALLRAIDKIGVSGPKLIKPVFTAVKRISPSQILESMGPDSALLAAIDTDHGYTGIVRNNGTGYLCGYICVPKGHPWYQELPENINASVHGGITYSGPGVNSCDDESFWWLGFDCAHYEDAPNPDLLDQHFEGAEEEKNISKAFLSKILSTAKRFKLTFKDTRFVLDEIKKLSEQAEHEQLTQDLANAETTSLKRL
jgi:hypothetical protein